MKKQSLIIGLVLFIIVIIVIIVIIKKFRSKESESFNDPIVSNDLDLGFLDDNKNTLTLKSIGNGYITFSSSDDIKNQIDTIINNKLLLLTETENKESISPDKYTPVDKLMALFPNIDNYKINTILMWNDDTLPSNKWAWCDGSNGSPDLRYRFPLGKNTRNPATPELDIVAPTDLDNSGVISIDNIPEHTHEATFNEGGEHKHGGKTSGNNIFNIPLYPWKDGATTNRNNITGSPGGGRLWTHGPDNHTHSCSPNYHDHTVSIPSYGKTNENIKPFLPKYSIVKYIIKIK